MYRPLPILFLVAVLVSSTVPTISAGAGSQEDAAFVRANCGGCHAVGRQDRTSPLKAAIPFADLAANPAISALALRVLLQTSHQTMPNLSLTPEQTTAVITYILDLRGASPQPGLTRINDPAQVRVQACAKNIGGDEPCP